MRWDPVLYSKCADLYYDINYLQRKLRILPRKIYVELSLVCNSIKLTLQKIMKSLLDRLGSMIPYPKLQLIAEHMRLIPESDLLFFAPQLCNLSPP